VLDLDGTLTDSGVGITKSVQYAATSKPTVFAERILVHFGIRDYFHTVAGSFLDGTRTDKSEIIGYVLRHNEIVQREAAMIGDRKHDLIGAFNNGIASIGAAYGYGTVEELAAWSPVAIVQTVCELTALLGADGHNVSESAL